MMSLRSRPVPHFGVAMVDDGDIPIARLDAHTMIPPKVSFAIGCLKYRFTGRRIPLSVCFDLTHRCTGDCVFCNLTKDRRPEMTTAQVVRAFDELQRVGMRRVALSGGDALLRDDLEEIIAAAKARGLYVSLNSNGVRLVERAARLRGIDGLAVSLDGGRGTHELTKRRTDFDGVVAALDWARSAGIPAFTLTTITSRNAGAIDEIIDVVEQHGARAAFHPVQRGDLCPDLPEDLLPDRRTLQGAVDRITVHKQNGRPVLNTTAYLNILRRFRYDAPDADCPPCLAGRLYAIVLPDGVVAPCHVCYLGAPFKNGLEIGFDRAFQEMPEFQCGKHCVTTSTEIDLLATLDPGVVSDVARQSIL
jgi:pyrroloquinoline quinone biosynthesis protein E